MTSWQNILDHLPTGTNRPAPTQEQNNYNPESNQKLANNPKNETEGRDIFREDERVLINLDASRQRKARERQLVFLPRKHSVSAPKFNLLGLKPTEDFQPYNLGFFQPHGLGSFLSI